MHISSALLQDLSQAHITTWYLPHEHPNLSPPSDPYPGYNAQASLAWPLHKDDTLFQSGRPTGLNIYFSSFACHFINS
ncbi:hypothetical protein F5888DRAFT_1712835 [Russula emetica]|nr:hypothetical protein F5888DRAFT_1712835 [Russula emetica]